MADRRIPDDAMMSTEGPQSMGGSPLEMLMSLLGRGPKDVHLPNETGQVDPRLPPDVGAALREALAGFKAVNKLGTK